MPQPAFIQVLNQCLNAGWTLFAFTPVIWLWATIGLDYRFYILLGISLLVLILPGRLIAGLQISDKKAYYERLGVKFIRKFVQDGDWVRSLEKGTAMSTIKNFRQARTYLTTLAMYERFHWICFILFTGSTIFAFGCGVPLLGIWILLTNIIYNIATILLQQYNRLRLHALLHNK